MIPDPCDSLLAIVARPTIATSACAVRPNHVLVENGYANTVITGAGGSNVVTYPQSVIRIGTSLPKLEIAFSPPVWTHASLGGAVVGGTQDIAFGAKYELGYTSKAIWGVNAQVSEPTGDHAFTSGSAQYTGNFNMSYALDTVLSVAGTLSVGSCAGFDAARSVERFFSLAPSLVLSAQPTANSQGFIEYTYFSKAGVGLGGRSLIDFGYARAITSGILWDAEYGFQPTLIAGQRLHYVGTGLSFMR